MDAFRTLLKEDSAADLDSLSSAVLRQQIKERLPVLTTKQNKTYSFLNAITQSARQSEVTMEQNMLIIRQNELIIRQNNELLRLLGSKPE